MEPLEGRWTPAVTATQDGAGVVTVTLGAASDTATVTGTAPAGTTLDVSGTGLATQTFTGVTGLTVVDAGANAGQAVTLTTDVDGAINLPGAVTVTGAEAVTVSPTTGPLRAGSVAVTGATTGITLNNGVTTTAAGGQSYGGPVVLGLEVLTLNAGSSGGITFQGTVDSAAGVPSALSVSAGGTTVFAGTVGGTAPLAGLATDAAGTTRIAANVTTTGAQTFADPVSLSGPSVILTSSASGAVTFSATVNGDAAGTTTLQVNTAGTTTFGGPVGSGLALASLTTAGGGITSLGGNVTTTGQQFYDDAVRVTGAAVTLTATAAGNVTFINTLNGQAAGGSAVTVNTAGETAFHGAVGGTAALLSLATDAPGTTLIASNVSTTGAQTFADPVTLAGTSVTLASSGSGNIGLTGSVQAQTGGVPALIVNTAGTTTFGVSAGGTSPLASLTTDAAGSTVFGTGAGTVTVGTTGNQAYNDAVRLNAAAVTFTSAGGNLTFAKTLDGTASGVSSATLNTPGTTTLTGAVGATQPLATLVTDGGASTVIGTGVRATTAQAYGEPVTITPAAGVTAVTVETTAGDLTFQSTLTGTAATPVTVRAGATLSFAGDVSFGAAGSQLTAQGGAAGTGSITFAAGVDVRADAQVWRAGDGPGGTGTTATANLTANAPAFRNAAGTAAPNTFVLRQDGPVTDATVPAVSQFGTAPPASYTIASDDGTLTLLTTTALAGTGTTNLTLGAAQALTLGTAVNAPAAVVRLRSTSGSVTQTAGGGITASSLGVRAATGIDLSAATAGNRISTTFAGLTTAGDLRLATAGPVTVGTVGTDPLSQVLTASISGATAGGAVAFNQAGGTALNLTIAAPVSGTAVTATGGAADDRVAVNYTLGGTLVGGLTFAGNGGNDTLALTDVGGATAHAYTVNGTVVRDGAAAVNYPGVENVSVTGGNLADTFTITPDANAALTLVGGLPLQGAATGDRLTVSLAGVTGASLSTTPTATGLSGTATSTNRRPVAFSEMESVSPQADIQVTATGPSTVPPGGTATLTVVVTNAGPDAASGVTITDVFPAGLTTSWTASATAGSSVAATSGTGDINTTADLAVNGSVTFTITTTAGGATGTFTSTATAGPASNAFDVAPGNNSAAVSFTVNPIALTAVGAGAGGGPQVKAYNADGTERFNFFAYDPLYRGGVTVATGDVNGDGFEDIVTGSAAGSSHVKVFDGQTGAELASFFAFPGFTGGVNVAVADGQVVVGAGPGGGPVVIGYQILGGLTQTFTLFAFDPAFRGGVAVGGSGQLLAVGAGPGGGPHVKVFELPTLTERASFFAFPPGSTDGVSVAIGLQNDEPTLIAGAGLGAPPTAVTYDALTATVLGSTLAFDTAFRGGVRVASTTLADGRAATVLGPGAGGGPRVRVLAPDRTPVFDFLTFDPAFLGGIYVG